MNKYIIKIILRLFPSIKKDAVREYHKEKDEKAERYLKANSMNAFFYEVAGAGKIEISRDCYHHTGRSFGFHFGVQWGQYGFCGGVMDREQAKLMAEHIMIEYNKVTPEKKAEEQKYLLERDERLKKSVLIK